MVPLSLLDTLVHAPHVEISHGQGTTNSESLLGIVGSNLIHSSQLELDLLREGSRSNRLELLIRHLLKESGGLEKIATPRTSEDFFDG